MREGDTDDTMSDPTILGRPARSVRGGEQWFTTSQLGSPSFSSPASATSMPSLEQPTASFEEGHASSPYHQALLQPNKTRLSGALMKRSSHHPPRQWLTVEKFLLLMQRLLTQ